MLTRQKTLLALLDEADKPVSPTMLVKLAFLLRHETTVADQRAFYDFVPYRFGPFSFNLYRELNLLRRDGYVAPEQQTVELVPAIRHLTSEKIAELPLSTRRATAAILSRYGELSLDSLLRDVYQRYPWYASRSELKSLVPCPSPVDSGKLGVYTVGYEGQSVDRLFNKLLRSGIQAIIDVRANPVSRNYGFSQHALQDISSKLGLQYSHLAELGISSAKRRELVEGRTRQSLLDEYERGLLPRLSAEVQEVANLMRERPSVLLCFEANPADCHRSRLATAVALVSNLDITDVRIDR